MSHCFQKSRDHIWTIALELAQSLQLQSKMPLFAPPAFVNRPGYKRSNSENYINMGIMIASQRRQESIYTVIELVGSSPTSWEDAARNAIDTASESLWNLRIGEVTDLDVKLDDKGKIALYRVKIKCSFKYDNWKLELGWKVPRCGSSTTTSGTD